MYLALTDPHARSAAACLVALDTAATGLTAGEATSRREPRCRQKSTPEQIRELLVRCDYRRDYVLLRRL